jgi:hypothetical protein
MVHHLEKSDCDARKPDVGSQSADTIKFNFINGFDDRQPAGSRRAAFAAAAVPQSRR